MLSLSDIHLAIEALSRELEKLVEEITQAGAEAAEKEAEYKHAFATARITRRSNGPGTVDAVDDWATVQTEKEHLARLHSQNSLKVLSEALRARQAQLDGYRTLAASYRGAGG